MRKQIPEVSRPYFYMASFKILVGNRKLNQNNCMKSFIAYVAGILIFLSNAGFVRNSNFNLTGIWRGVFSSNNYKIPFNFQIKADGTVYFLNAEEKFPSGKAKIIGDSLFIPLDPFDNELAFSIRGNSLQGILRKQDGSGSPIPVEAEKGKKIRFENIAGTVNSNITGTYDITFKSTVGADEKAVGLFIQNGNQLRATFLRVTGDSRYLEGVVSGNEFYLSSFIGSSPVYYHGVVSSDHKLSGESVFARGTQSFLGDPNEEATLPDAFGLTYLKEGYHSLSFSFPDVNGKLISLSDDKYKNKVVIITITGSWCPNCIDEASFLAPWYIKNKSRGVEAIAIHYERKTDSAFTAKAISRFRKKYDIRYDQVIGGLADKQKVASSLPALNTFLAFPTTIFIDKKGNVAKIHTGYSGPATGKHYQEFQKEFNETVDSLLQQ
ncbi:MAG: hypothetical protein C5B52_09890 [Bacteroidetes bacterium]|nr:MAG: hypothetical protein C5B52_09890 [Bacteroidota bacterium]